MLQYGLYHANTQSTPGRGDCCRRIVLQVTAIQSFKKKGGEVMEDDDRVESLLQKGPLFAALLSAFQVTEVTAAHAVAVVGGLLAVRNEN